MLLPPNLGLNPLPAGARAHSGLSMRAALPWFLRSHQAVEAHPGAAPFGRRNARSLASTRSPQRGSQGELASSCPGPITYRGCPADHSRLPWVGFSPPGAPPAGQGDLWAGNCILEKGLQNGEKKRKRKKKKEEGKRIRKNDFSGN